jgi:outer membrane phospholipase A
MSESFGLQRLAPLASVPAMAQKETGSFQTGRAGKLLLFLLLLSPCAKLAAAEAGVKDAAESTAATPAVEAKPKPGPFDPGYFLKEHLSGYEPMYFVVGPESPNAKFQISLKYQLLNNEGPLAQKVPLMRGLHVAYTQTSLWDWNQTSAPFLDSSYKPEVLYLWERAVGGEPGSWFRLDLQPGLQHESNGKGGLDSRSLNIAYLRPTATFGRDDAFQVTVQPRAWVYLGDLSDNPDIALYRGYADLRLIAGWKANVQLSATGRLGDRGDRASLQLDLTFPLMKIWRNFSAYLDAQYFIGYGESLLLYNERSSAYRFGFSIYR